MSATVVDANVVMYLISTPDGFDEVSSVDLIAPPLLWPEVRSVLHVARWRGLLADADARRALEIFGAAPIRERRHRRLGAEAWRIADDLGWMKTYDAEYLALASLTDVAIASRDGRMRRAAERIGIDVRQLV